MPRLIPQKSLPLLAFLPTILQGEEERRLWEERCQQYIVHAIVSVPIVSSFTVIVSPVVNTAKTAIALPAATTLSTKH
jgi:hypothetical protein